MIKDWFLTEKIAVTVNRISVGPEQDWTTEVESRMGSLKSDLFAIAAKKLSLKQLILFGEAIDDRKEAGSLEDG